MKPSPELFKRIVDLLQPHMTESGRHTLITPAFSTYDELYSRIDWSGSNRDFTTRIVEQFVRYRQVKPDQEALVLLLETLREQVGVDVQRQIDEILNELSTLPPQKSIKQKHIQRRQIFLVAGVGLLLMLIAVVLYRYPRSTPAPPTDIANSQCEYAVVVRDLATDTALANAKLTLEYQLDSYVKSTNSEGRYRGEFACVEAHQSYILRVEAAGYLPYTNEFILQPEFAKIYLLSSTTPLCHHVLTVLDQATLIQISNAKVQIELGLYHTTGYTDSEGYLSTELPCTEESSSIKVRVAASDYEPYRVEYYLNDEIQEIRLTRK